MRRPIAAAAALGAMLAAAGCGSHGATRSTAAHPTATRSTATGTRAAAKLDGCLALGDGAHRITLRPAGAAPVTAAVVGRGATAFVLSNESDENLCAWLPFVRRAIARHDAVVVYDDVSEGDIPDDALAGARAARKAGARRVVIMGASVGARGSVRAAARAHGTAAALVTLSAERTVRSDPQDLLPSARRVRVPALVVAARGDPYVAGAIGPLARALGGHPTRLIVVGGIDHGTDLLADRTGGDTVTDRILAFAASAR